MQERESWMADAMKYKVACAITAKRAPTVKHEDQDHVSDHALHQIVFLCIALTRPG